MKTDLKNTRDWLNKASLKGFTDAVREAKLTPRQEEIINLRFLKKLTNYQIGTKLNISTKLVDKEINTAYQAVCRILFA